MAANAQNQGGGIIEGINVTPLVDIMLVLLVIFMVTAKIAVAPAVPLELPRASQAEEVQTILAFTVTADGALAINGEPCPDAEVRRRAESMRSQEPGARAVIQADRAVSHGRVMFVLDELKSAGIEHVAFGALKPEPLAASLLGAPTR